MAIFMVDEALCNTGRDVAAFNGAMAKPATFYAT
jgi:hypothetical protein